MRKMRRIGRKMFAAVLAIAMLVTMLPGNMMEARAAEDSVKLQIKYGDDTLIKITESEWEDLLGLYGKTIDYSIQPRDPNPPLIETHTGVALNDLLKLYDINAEEITGTVKITFRSDLNEEMKKLSLDDVFQTKRYSYQINESGTGFVEETGVEVPVMINEDGDMCFGQKDTSEYNNQYNWNGLFNTEENQFVSIEIPLAGTNEAPKENNSRPECDYALAADSFASGTGTEEDPYLISNAAELWYLSKLVNTGETFAGKYLKLTDDIDLKKQEWMPIGGDKTLADGTATYKFMGTFDGNGKTIKNLYLNTDYNFTALFGYNGGTLKNFTVEGTLICTGEYDYIGGVTGFNAGTISGVISKVQITAEKGYNTGGIAGINVAGKWDAYTDSSDTKQQRTIEGAVGIIKECGNEGNITANRSTGGITGTNHGTISYCYNYGDIDIKWNGSMSKNGGIAGTCGNTGDEWGFGHISNCYNTGDIGWSGVAASRGYGGITCFISASSTVTNCYSIGDLEQGYDDFTPIVPRYDLSKYLVNNYSLDTIQCHYDFFTRGEVVSDLFKIVTSGYRRTESELKSEAFLAEIGGAYAADENKLNNGYPVLKWQNGAFSAVTKLECDTTELSFTEGETFNAGAINIYAVYKDGTKEYISSSNYTVSKTDAFSMSDDGTIVTVTCEVDGVKGSFDIKINMVGKTLKEIAIWNIPEKYVYTEGEEFDPSGMSVRATFVNDEDGSESVSEIEDYVCTTEGKLTKENNTVTISYTVKDVTKTDSFEVVVLENLTEPSKDQAGIYQITTADELMWLADQVSYFGNTAVNAVLVNDIDVSERDYTPIGLDKSQTLTTTSGRAYTYRWNNPYTGSFDGNGKTVTLALKDGGCLALIGYADGAVVNDVIVEGTVDASETYAAGIVAYGSATVAGCVNNADITNQASYTGGITGYVEGTVTECKNTGNITGVSYVGGITARDVKKAVNCGNEGKVTATGSYAGGIAAWGAENAEFTGCYNIGNVSGTKNVGGIVGAGYVSKVENCYNKGNVNGSAVTPTESVGGIVGTKHKNYKLAVTNCYNAGMVSGDGGSLMAGELIGYAAHKNTDGAETIISNSYYLQKSGETKKAVGYITNEVYLTDGSKAKSLAELSEGALLGSAYKDSCCGAVLKTQKTIQHSWETSVSGNATVYTCTVPECGYSTVKEMKFTDVNTKDWYYTQVKYVFEHGIMKGTNAEGTVFSPNNKITRAEVAQLLYNLSGEGVTQAQRDAMEFTDVLEGQWYYDAIAWASAKGVVNGTGNGTFNPHAYITREQIAVMLCNYASKYVGADTTASKDLSGYADNNDISSWARTAMEWAVAEGVISGQGSNGVVKVAPKANAMRSEVATMCCNFCKNVLED